MRHLEERDDRTGADARATISLGALVLPDGVKDVVRARLARLGPAAPILRLAAVAGRDFEIELLAGALDGSREQMIEALDAALDAQLIREADRRDMRRTSFAPLKRRFDSAVALGLRWDCGRPRECTP